MRREYARPCRRLRQEPILLKDLRDLAVRQQRISVLVEHGQTNSGDWQALFPKCMNATSRRGVQGLSSGLHDFLRK